MTMQYFMERARANHPLLTLQIQISDGTRLHGREAMLDERDTSAIYALVEELAGKLLEDMKGDPK